VRESTMTAKPLVILGAVLAAATANANLIVNGSFEDPTQPPNSVSPVMPIPGWGLGTLFNGNVGSSFPLGPAYPLPEDGNQFALMSGLPLSQTFTVGSTGQYLLSWFANAPIDYPLSYTVSLTGNPTLTFNTGVGSATWSQETELLTLNAGTSYTLSFQGNGTNLLDNVSLDPAGASTPETGNTLFLFVFACASICWVASHWLSGVNGSRCRINAIFR